MDALEAQAELAGQIVSRALLGEVHQQHVEQVAVVANAASLLHVMPHVIDRTAPMDDTKSAWATLQQLHAEIGVGSNAVMLTISIVGILKKLEQNSVGGISEIPDFCANCRQKFSCQRAIGYLPP